tara:strand:- start:45 stop:791 length:747 start_codon:yes stop_codon:yes gene_type:complete
LLKNNKFFKNKKIIVKSLLNIILMKYKLGYSIIANNLLKVTDTIEKLNFVDFLHVDIMDGNFVDELTIGPQYVHNLIELISEKNLIKQYLDVHLMVNNPINYIDKLPNVNSIIFQVENLNNYQILEIINSIKAKNSKCGISISPNTSIDNLINYLNLIDIVQIMTVEPGKCGQKLIKSTLTKIYNIRNINSQIIIQVDGGINKNNIIELLNMGANSFICGSSMMKDGLEMKSILDKYFIEYINDKKAC